MSLKEIVSISGKPGLFKIIATTQRGVLVESMDDKKTRMPVNASQQVASLEEITIYTPGEESIPLNDVFVNMKNQEAELAVPNGKSNPVAIKEYFEKVAPGYDKERVYMSDMKKILKWYDILRSNEVL